MKNLRRNTLALAVLFLLVFPLACRTKTKPVTAPTPPPETIAEAPPVPVEQPDDFVEPQEPTPTAEDLPADLTELNRRAQQQGWIRDAFFEYDEATLTSESQENLAISASWLKSHAQYDLLVEGHCDERGTEQYNLALGDRRANATRDYLMTLGVDGSRIRTVSYGEERPFATGSNEGAWRQNRRGHLVLVGK